MSVVRTSSGTLLQQYPVGVDPKSAPPLTQEEAEHICEVANRKAKKLGIEARYEVMDK